MESGIYKITCVENGKIYIGSARNMRNRWWQHRGALRNNKHDNPYLQFSCNKYGIDSFHFKVLEYCEVENLLEREQEWILKLNSHIKDKGFNIDLPLKCKERFEGRYKKTNGERTYRKVIGLNILSGQKMIFDSTGKASKSTNVTTSHIRDIINYWKNIKICRKGRRSDKGYIFMYEDEYDETRNYLSLYPPKKERVPKIKRIVKPRIKKESTPRKTISISIKNLETKEVKDFESMIEASRFLKTSPSKIGSLKRGFEDKGKGRVSKVHQIKGWELVV